MKLFKKILCSALVLVCLLSLVSCSSETEQISALDTVKALSAAEIGLPAGKIYSSKAQKGEDGYIPPSLISSLYGGGSLPKTSEGWIEYALFLSSKEPLCEFAVILCSSHENAEDTARILCSRASLISNEDNSRIIIRGNTVCMIVSRDPESAEKIFIGYAR